MQLYNGDVVDPFKFDMRDFDPTSVAQSLAKLNRFTGHTKFMYTVAQHCLLVASLAEMLTADKGFIARRRARAGGLLHDSAESLFGDIASPIKHTPSFADARAAEDRVLEMIYAHHFTPTLTPEERKIIHEADQYALSLEAVALMDTTNPIWQSQLERYPITAIGAGWRIKEQPWREVAVEWENEYYVVSGARHFDTTGVN